MIISTKKGTPKEELEKIVDKFEHQGLDVTLITGKDYNVFGLVGDTPQTADRAGLLLLRGVTQGGGLGHIDFYVNVTWSGNQVSWYTSKDNPSTQMNSEGVEYFYFAIG